MTLKEQVERDFLRAYKAKETVSVAVLRHLKTAIKNREIELGSSLDDQEVLSLVGRQAKQRKESIEQFEKGGRPELAENERQELTVLQDYLPQQLSREELSELIDQAVEATGAQSMADMGMVMSQVMGQTKGRADGKVVSELVRAKLNR